MTPAGDSTQIEARINALEQQLRELRPRRRRLAPAVPRTRAPRMRSLIAIGVMLVVVALPAGIAASHQFGDVPDGNIFHNNISDIADAGITAGCGGGNYCPDSAVSRGQMAAFMHRGFGRVEGSSGFHSVTSETVGTYDIETVSIKAGDVTGGHGYILVTGNASLTTQSATPCPCTLNIWVEVDGVDSGFDAWEVVTDTTGPFGASDWRFGNASVTEVFYVTTGVAHTVVLRATVTRTASSSVGLETSLTALYVPFDGNGDVVAPALPLNAASANNPSN